MFSRSFAVAIFASWVFGAPAASASWDTTVAEDVFSGKFTAELLGVSDPQMGLLISCDTNRKLEISILLQYTGARADGVSASARIRIDKSEPFDFPVSSRTRNEQYLGFINDQDRELIVSVLRQIAVAKSSILVGLRADQVEEQFTGNMDAIGSSAAVRKFASTCEVDIPQ